MNTIIKPIETQYDGIRFRSRLEARWAVFFNALSIPWNYEVEGFDLGKLGFYLPDFWLPRHRYLIEIKAEYPTDEQTKKASLAAEAMQANGGYVFYGQIPANYLASNGNDSLFGANLVFDGWDNLQAWCECLFAIVWG
jgi:hypothetical protein